jgi:hypothetical protein
MPRKKTIPLEHHLTQLLALRGTITMRSAMHYTGVIPPDPKGGGKACDHGADKAADGRCVACKREADQRLYRNKAYRKALAALVEQGIARPAGKDMWAYAGKAPMAGPKIRPRLPAEPGKPGQVHDTTGELYTRLMAVMRPDAQHAAGTGLHADAAQGRRHYDHEDCDMCEAIETQSAAAHYDVRNDSGETPAEAVRNYGGRQTGHERCLICEDIEGGRRDDPGRAARVRRYDRAMDTGRPYAYMPDGRRIQSDGSLCTCQRCDQRVRVRASAARTAARDASTTWATMTAYTPSMTYTTAPVMADQITFTIDPQDNRYEPDDTLRCRDAMASHPDSVAGAAAAGGHSRYICYARRGHTGDHIGYSGPGRHAPGAVWPQAISNEYEPDASMRCLDDMRSHPDAVDLAAAAGHSASYSCFARRGHDGNHMGWYGTETLDPWATWPQAVSDDGTMSNGYETDYTRQCRDENNPVGYVCTARAGHSGNHMGWYQVSGEPCRNDDATWPQVTSGDDTRTEER